MFSDALGNQVNMESAGAKRVAVVVAAWGRCSGEGGRVEQ